MADGILLELDDAPVVRGLNQLSGIDRTRAMDAIGAYLVTSTQRRFERETGPDGKPWAPLSPRTANRRIGRRRRGTQNMLRVSNRLYSSISYRADEKSVAVGTNLAYAAIQQLGGEVKKPERQQTIYQRYNEKTGDLKGFVKKSRSNFARDVAIGAHTITVPARPYLGLDDADRAEIMAIIGDHQSAALSGASR